MFSLSWPPAAHLVPLVHQAKNGLVGTWPGPDTHTIVSDLLAGAAGRGRLHWGHQKLAGGGAGGKGGGAQQQAGAGCQGQGAREHGCWVEAGMWVPRALGPGWEGGEAPREGLEVGGGMWLEGEGWEQTGWRGEGCRGRPGAGTRAKQQVALQRGSFTDAKSWRHGKRCMLHNAAPSLACTATQLYYAIGSESMHVREERYREKGGQPAV